VTDLTTTLRNALAGRYSIEREIGHGGMASVFLAHDVRHGRPVAVKVLYPQLALAIGADRFLREIQVVARLRHPHIVPLYDSGEAGGLLYYVMPYIEGESLRDRLKRDGRLPVADALRITREVADALDYAHGEGVVHRDIKPDNVMLDGRHALVTDFGIARALSTADEATLTATGLFIGTPAYMSPEQVSGEQAIDGRSDVYALGCVLYEMLVGEPPFAGPTAQAVMARRFATPVPSMDALRQAVSAPVEEIVATALRPAPAERFASARAMGEAVDAATMAAHGGSATPAPAARTAPRRRGARMWVGGSALVLVILAIAYASTRRTTGSSLASPAGATGAPDVAVSSVGVLPFLNRSDDRTMEYFSDGVTDELISALSRVEGLQVAGRASSFSLKGKNLDPRDAAQQLQVTYVIDGSVRSSGPAVRVTWELMDSRNAKVVGSGQFDGEMRNVIALQDSLARQIVEKLRPALGAMQPVSAVRHQTTDFEAHDLYLKGHFYWNQRTPETMRQGIAYLKQAIARDSNYALAWAELSSAYTLEPAFGDMPSSEVIHLARAAASRAVQLDSTLSDAYTALGMSSTFNDWDWPKAVAYLDRAVALDPKNPSPHLFRVWPLVILGRLDEALAEILRARELDPLAPIINARLGTTYDYRHEYKEAAAVLQKALALDPSNIVARFELAKTLGLAGRFDEAFSGVPDALDAESGYCMGWIAVAYGLAGRRDDARAILRRLEARAKERFITPEALALANLGSGDKSAALDWLERGLREHAIYMVFIGRDPVYDGLRDEPRFKEILRKMHM
jgi:eukaryotic-like serine/threonine-protein kinase